MFRKTTFASLAILLGAAAAATAAPIVTMTQTNGVVRSLAQGAGTYNVLDFYLTNSQGAEFTNYRLITTAVTGSLADPARLQDDRQQDNVTEANTAGSVDTYANTVMSAAAKDDGGYTATINVNGASYSPTGSGAAPAFNFLDWSVFDTATGDDNDLNDYPAAGGGPFAKVAPYHIARVLTSTDAAGTVQFQAFDTAGPGVPAIFNFTFAVPEPATLSLLGLAMVGGFGFIRRRK